MPDIVRVRKVIETIPMLKEESFRVGFVAKGTKVRLTARNYVVTNYFCSKSEQKLRYSEGKNSLTCHFSRHPRFPQYWILTFSHGSWNAFITCPALIDDINCKLKAPENPKPSPGLSTMLFPLEFEPPDIPNQLNYGAEL